MIDLLLILLVIPLLGCLFALLAKKNETNVFDVVLFTVASNIAATLCLLSQVMNASGQAVENCIYRWHSAAGIEFSFGADPFSLILLLGVYIALLIGTVGLLPQQRKEKSGLLMALYFMWCITGFLTARDMVSFYMFFAGMV